MRFRISNTDRPRPTEALTRSQEHGDSLLDPSHTSRQCPDQLDLNECFTQATIFRPRHMGPTEDGPTEGHGPPAVGLKSPWRARARVAAGLAKCQCNHCSFGSILLPYRQPIVMGFLLPQCRALLGSLTQLIAIMEHCGFLAP